jgi:hypothetical protein
MGSLVIDDDLVWARLDIHINANDWKPLTGTRSLVAKEEIEVETRRSSWEV